MGFARAERVLRVDFFLAEKNAKQPEQKQGIRIHVPGRQSARHR
jgi:hypothetical protein